MARKRATQAEFVLFDVSTKMAPSGLIAEFQAQSLAASTEMPQHGRQSKNRIGLSSKSPATPP